MPGAALDLDFARGRYYGGSLASLLSTSRASGDYVTNADGTLTWVAANLPRIGVGTGLLIEEARTNLLLRSQEFDNAAWTQSNLTVTANQTAAPTGEMTADKINETTNTNSFYIQQTNLSFTSAVVYVLSVWARQSERGWVRISAGNGSNSPFGSGTYSTDRSCYFNLSNGTLGTKGSAFSASSIAAFADGWYRCTATITAQATGTGNFDIGIAKQDLEASYSGTAGSGIFVWGAQVELGSFPTSYIPTEGSTVTRAADAITASGLLATLLAGSEGGVVAEFTAPLTSGNATRIFESNGQFGLGMQNAALAGVAFVSRNAFVNLAQTSNGFTSNALAKVAASWGTGNSVVMNGGTVATSATGAPGALSTFYIGNRAQLDRALNGYLRRLTVFPTKLPDATLQARTVLP